MFKKTAKILLVCLCVLCLTPIKTLGIDDKQNTKIQIVKISTSMGVDPYIMLSIAKIETDFVHEKKGRDGAVGLFQIMPGTAKILGINPYLKDENIKGAALYYKKMYKMFGSTDLALAAYNAGEGNVKKYGGVPPFATTKKFIAQVKADSKVFKEDKELDPKTIAKKEQEAKQKALEAKKKEEEKKALAQAQAEALKKKEEEQKLAENLAKANEDNSKADDAKKDKKHIKSKTKEEKKSLMEEMKELIKHKEKAEEEEKEASDKKAKETEKEKPQT